MKLITNPYRFIDFATVNQYRALLHCHTVASDGGKTGHMIVEKYAPFGYKIFAWTDHDGHVAYPQAAIHNSWPWADYLEAEGDATLAPIGTYTMDQATNFINVHGGILAIQGKEVGDDMNAQHIISLDNDYLYNKDEEPAIEEIMHRGGLCYCAHPQTVLLYWDTARYVNAFTTYRNSLKAYCICSKYDDLRAEIDARLDDWDDILMQMMPYTPVYAMGEDDFHYNNHAFGAYPKFLMPELKRGYWRESFIRGAYFVCNTPSKPGTDVAPKIEDITVTDSTIVITSSDADTIKWVYNKEVLQTGASFDHSEIDDVKYIRAELENTGGRTWTNPFGFVNHNSALISHAVQSSIEGSNYPFIFP